MAAYSEKAQPYLDAIAEGVFGDQKIRDWVIQATPHEAAYFGASVLIDEQRAVRWHAKPTKQPFWANYHCGKDKRCTCRIEGSDALESDAIFSSETKLALCWRSTSNSNTQVSPSNSANRKHIHSVPPALRRRIPGGNH